MFMNCVYTYEVYFTQETSSVMNKTYIYIHRILYIIYMMLLHVFDLVDLP